jgi:hypothetical protein
MSNSRSKQAHRSHYTAPQPNKILHPHHLPPPSTSPIIPLQSPLKPLVIPRLGVSTRLLHRAASAFVEDVALVNGIFLVTLYRRLSVVIQSR